MWQTGWQDLPALRFARPLASFVLVAGDVDRLSHSPEQSRKLFNEVLPKRDREWQQRILMEWIDQPCREHVPHGRRHERAVCGVGRQFSMGTARADDRRLSSLLPPWSLTCVYHVIFHAGCDVPSTGAANKCGQCRVQLVWSTKAGALLLSSTLFRFPFSLLSCFRQTTGCPRTRE